MSDETPKSAEDEGFEAIVPQLLGVQSIGSLDAFSGRLLIADPCYANERREGEGDLFTLALRTKVRPGTYKPLRYAFGTRGTLGPANVSPTSSSPSRTTRSHRASGSLGPTRSARSESIPGGSASTTRRAIRTQPMPRSTIGRAGTDRSTGISESYPRLASATDVIRCSSAGTTTRSSVYSRAFLTKALTNRP
jgi:hypothetical protein